MLISLCEFTSSPDRAFEIKKDNAQLINIKNQNKRSQDLKKNILILVLYISLK